MWVRALEIHRFISVFTSLSDHNVGPSKLPWSVTICRTLNCFNFSVLISICDYCILNSGYTVVLV